MDYDKMLREKKGNIQKEANDNQTTPNNYDTSSTQQERNTQQTSNQEQQPKTQYSSEDYSKKAKQLKDYISALILNEGFAKAFQYLGNICTQGNNCIFFATLVKNETGDSSLKNAIMSFMNSIIVDNPIVGERANEFYE